MLINGLKSQLEKANKKQNENEKIIEQLTNEITKIKKEIEVYILTCKDNNELINLKDSDISFLKNQIEDLNNKLKEMKDQSDILQQSVESKDNIIKSSLTDLEKLNNLLTSKEGKITTLNTSLSNKSRAISDLENKVKEFEPKALQLIEWKEICGKLNIEIDNLKKDATDLDNKVQDVINKLKLADDTISAHCKEIEQLKSEIEKLKA